MRIVREVRKTKTKVGPGKLTVRNRKTKTNPAGEKLIVRRRRRKDERPKKLIVSSFGVARTVSENPNMNQNRSD